MLFIFTLFIANIWAQELEVTTADVQAYARVKNCIDFYLCHPYEESLKIISGKYYWKAKFNEPLSSIQKAFDDCSVDEVEADILAKDAMGKIKKDFLIPRSPISYLTKRHLLPMELTKDTYVGLRKKESIIDKLLNQRVLDLAMKSTTFEFEYGLGEYVLRAAPLPPNVLGQTHHLFKTITYDVEKYDGKICRFYQVMRHEVQHVRNWREKNSCKQKSKNHHFKNNNHNEISTYLNDLVFIKRYCPYEQEIFNNTQAMLIAMYENKKLQPCSSGASGESTSTADGANSRQGNESQIGKEGKANNEKVAESGKNEGSTHKVASISKRSSGHHKISKFKSSYDHEDSSDSSNNGDESKDDSSSVETHRFPTSIGSNSNLSRQLAAVVGCYRKMINSHYDYDESKPYGFRKKEIPENPNNLR